MNGQKNKMKARSDYKSFRWNNERIASLSQRGEARQEAAGPALPPLVLDRELWALALSSTQ